MSHPRNLPKKPSSRSPDYKADTEPSTSKRSPLHLDDTHGETPPSISLEESATAKTLARLREDDKIINKNRAQVANPKPAAVPTKKEHKSVWGEDSLDSLLQTDTEERKKKATKVTDAPKQKQPTRTLPPIGGKEKDKDIMEQYAASRSDVKGKSRTGSTLVPPIKSFDSTRPSSRPEDASARTPHASRGETLKADEESHPIKPTRTKGR